MSLRSVGRRHPGELKLHPRASAEEIRSGQPKGLAAELLGRRDIDRFRRRMGVDGLGVRRSRAHFLPALPLRRSRHVTVETGHLRDDDRVAVGLIHAIAQAATNGPER